MRADLVSKCDQTTHSAYVGEATTLAILEARTLSLTPSRLDCVRASDRHKSQRFGPSIQRFWVVPLYLGYIGIPFRRYGALGELYWGYIGTPFLRVRLGPFGPIGGLRLSGISKTRVSYQPDGNRFRPPGHSASFRANTPLTFWISYPEELRL